MKFDNDGADSDAPRRSRGDSERRSGERKSFGGRSNGNDRKRFDDKKEFGNKEDSAMPTNPAVSAVPANPARTMPAAKATLTAGRGDR